MLRKIQKAARLPFRRKVLFARVSVMLVALHFALRLFPFASVYRHLKRRQSAPKPRRAAPTAQADICWAVGRAGLTWLGDDGCLAQSLLGELLLARQGIPTHLRIGVRKDESGALLAHAWVESLDGQPLIGGRTNLRHFQNLPEIQSVIEQQRGEA